MKVGEGGAARPTLGLPREAVGRHYTLFIYIHHPLHSVRTHAHSHNINSDSDSDY